MGGEIIVTGHSTAVASRGFPRMVHALGAAAPRWWVMLDCTWAHPHAGARSNSLVFTQHKSQEDKPSGSKPAQTSQLGFSRTNAKAELGHNQRSPHCFPQLAQVTCDPPSSSKPQEENCRAGLHKPLELCVQRTKKKSRKSP